MRRISLALLFPVLAAALALGQSPALGQSEATDSAHPDSSHRRLTPTQARRIVLLVARHEDIDLSDIHIELNSMDMGADFVPGFSSFIILRESTTPGPDETLRRYAVSRRTGDVWEINLCTHYDFPELTRMQKALTGRISNQASEITQQGRQLGCAAQKVAPAS